MLFHWMAWKFIISVENTLYSSCNIIENSIKFPAYSLCLVPHLSINSTILSNSAMKYQYNINNIFTLTNHFTRYSKIQIYLHPYFMTNPK